MDEYQLNTPVAFIIFNRPDTTERVFSEIARVKPPKLLVVGDGPRANRPGEAAKVAATRDIIGRVNWDCEVLTNFSDTNLGCKRRVSSGLDWVFQQVEEAIVLEDDCLPHPTFFRFCEELLEKYRRDLRVSQILGLNLQFGYRINDDAYYFSRESEIWGWASWRDRWQNNYDVDMNSWPKIRDEGRLVDWFCSSDERAQWGHIYEMVYEGKIDTWDYQWDYACRLAGQVSVVPNVNLISNIGFGAEATHTKDDSHLANMPIDAMPFPLKHPEGVYSCNTLDRRRFEMHFKPGLLMRIRGKIGRLLK
jgi:hypothetical protein